MSPKRAAAGSGKDAKKSVPRRASEAPSPMRTDEIAHGPNVDGHDRAARAAHNPGEPYPETIEVAEPNTPPSTSISSSPDEGTRS